MRHAAGQLDIGCVVAARAEGDLVLPGGARSHELVRSRPAHHTGIRIHHDVAEAAAVEDLAIGLLVSVVRDVEGGLVGVEGVGVLHEELPGAQHPRARPRLVALLGLDLVPDLREIAIGANLPRGQPRHDFLVRHAQAHVALVPVLEAEHLPADGVPAPRLLPDLRGMQHRHGQLLAADAIHLLADDGVDLLDDPQPDGQVDVDARRELADEPRADHELVADGLGVGRVLPQRGNERAGPAHGLGSARYLVGPGHARIVEQALDGPAAQDVRFDDLLQIGFLHARVPDVLGIHDDHGAVAALREAPRLVDADLRLLPRRDRARAEGLDELLHVALLRTSLPRGADEYVAAILAHGRPRQRKKNRWKTSSRDRSL